jgi:hypothetical protein
MISGLTRAHPVVSGAMRDAPMSHVQYVYNALIP